MRYVKCTKVKPKSINTSLTKRNHRQVKRKINLSIDYTLSCAVLVPRFLYIKSRDERTNLLISSLQYYKPITHSVSVMYLYLTAEHHLM